MSYLTMTGQLVNVLTTQPRVDRKTGEMIPARHQVQLQVAQPLETGDQRLELVTLTVGDRAPYDRLGAGNQVAIPVGVFVAAGKLQFFVPKAGAAAASGSHAQRAPGSASALS